MPVSIQSFKSENALKGTLALFDSLGIVLKTPSERPISLRAMMGDGGKALNEVLDKIETSYFVGTIDDKALHGEDEACSLDDELAAIDEHYKGMMVFAVEARPDAQVSKKDIATLTRSLNRLSKAAPVALVVRYADKFSISICERTAYKQASHVGEKAGRVSILRDIDIENTHRGHIDILEMMRTGGITSFDELYAKWLEVFSNETLTKRFYRELSNWYALAIQVIRFPNNLKTTADDQKYNHEGAIRLITRLIFVWFLKQRRLIPAELFDPGFVGEKLLKEFNPHETTGLFNESVRKSHYYRAILQNIFFATLNCPLTKDGKKELTERRFKDKNNRGQYNVNNLMRYRDLFSDPDLFIEMCNTVPFLNCGLFDCLDEKGKDGMYYDGFSERQYSIDQLCVPDYLFFSDDIKADLSGFYDDKKLKHATVRGLINIFNSYQFTVEENTPLDQEVALDPELLGKVFENLLAAFNPETKTTARKQTGSFYTPREIVKYMVDESLIAHLKRTVDPDLEEEYRKLLSYSDSPTNLTSDQKKAIMKGLYNCRILDPACGSGAFPMGILQQMVHVLTKIDPDNTEWKNMLMKIAVDDTTEAYHNSSSEERAQLIADIERTFDAAVNRPDYARKLYLIENCIYGVDIQPIAIQISKLRFFISLVIDQITTTDPSDNFGIRPLPNLEAKFVAANSLRSISRATNLGDTESVKQLKNELKNLNHRIFSIRSWPRKKQLQNQLAETRQKLADELASIGMFSESESIELASWDVFDQNHYANFFDPEWMFGVKDGFDIVIANPPYVRRTQLSDIDKRYYESTYHSAYKQYDLYILFIEKGLFLLKNKGGLCYINPIKFLVSDYGYKCRELLLAKATLDFVVDVSQISVFDASTYPCILFVSNEIKDNAILHFDKFESINKTIPSNKFINSRPINHIKKDKYIRIILNCNESHNRLIQDIENASSPTSDFFINQRGVANTKVDFSGIDNLGIKSTSIGRYVIEGTPVSLNVEHKRVVEFLPEMVIMPRTVKNLRAAIKPKGLIVLDRIYYLTPKNNSLETDFIVGLYNSKIIDFWFSYYFDCEKVRGGYFDLKGPQIDKIPIPPAPIEIQKEIGQMVRALTITPNDLSLINRIDFLVYKLFKISYDEVLVVDPQTPFSREEYENYIINQE